VSRYDGASFGRFMAIGAYGEAHLRQVRFDFEGLKRKHNWQVGAGGEDIIDSGLTLAYIRRLLMARQPVGWR